MPKSAKQKVKNRKKTQERKKKSKEKQSKTPKKEDSTNNNSESVVSVNPLLQIAEEEEEENNVRSASAVKNVAALALEQQKLKAQKEQLKQQAAIMARSAARKKERSLQAQKVSVSEGGGDAGGGGAAGDDDNWTGVGKAARLEQQQKAKQKKWKKGSFDRIRTETMLPIERNRKFISGYITEAISLDDLYNKYKFIHRIISGGDHVWNLVLTNNPQIIIKMPHITVHKKTSHQPPGFHIYYTIPSGQLPKRGRWAEEGEYQNIYGQHGCNKATFRTNHHGKPNPEEELCYNVWKFWLDIIGWRYVYCESLRDPKEKALFSGFEITKEIYREITNETLEERRFDTDGKLYTKESFLNVYKDEGAQRWSGATKVEEYRQVEGIKKRKKLMKKKKSSSKKKSIKKKKSSKR